MAVTKNSWVYRKMDGFGKSNSSGKIFYERGGRYAENKDAMNYEFGGSNAPGNATMPRPSTAVPMMTGSMRPPEHDMRRSMPNIHFEVPNEMTTTAARPQTASASMLRPSADRTGKFFFQNKGQAPEMTRKLAKVPGFVETEKVVTRFYAFFNYDRTYDRASALGAPSIAKADARYLTILFYVADGTCEISETKEQNSGLEGGVFYGRARLSNDDGGMVNLRDLAPGNVLRALGREIHIFDADSFTRDYFRRELLLALPPVVAGPDSIRPDQSAQQATGLGFHKDRNMKQSHGVRSTDYFQRKEDLEKTRRYLQFDGRLLRFVCVDAPGTKSASTGSGVGVEMNAVTGEMELVVPSTIKKFALTFTLSDSSIEMRVQKSKNSANIDNWLLLKKSRLPRNWKDVQRGQPQELYEPSDLIVGSSIDIYGRKFLLVDCDEYSRDYYSDRGIEQPVLHLVVDDGPVYVHEVPQQGDSFLPIGSPEDTLATCYGMPKIVNMTKVSRTQNRQMRCKIKILSKNSIDGSRPLQLIFHLNDDSIQIYEVPVRNSGISGGNYLKRGRYINTLPPAGQAPRRFVKTDIFLGNVFSINGQEMQVLEMDSATLRFCEAYAHEFPMSDTFKIVHGMVENTMHQRIDLRAGFKKFDPNGVGHLDQNQFIRALDSWGLTGHLNDQELITILRRFQSKLPGQPNVVCLYHELCDLFSHICSAQQSYARHGSLKNLNQGKIDDLGELLGFLRSRTTQWRRAIRKECTIPGRVTLEVFASVLKTHGVLISDDAKASIRIKYGTSPTETSSLIKVLRVADGSLSKAADLPSKVTKSKLSKMNLSGHQSSSRMNATSEMGTLGTMLVDDIDMAARETAEAAKNNQTAVQAAIVKRRQKLMASVLRSDGQELKRIEEERLAAEAETQFLLADSSVVINYDALCNDIYICDWA
jgi:hypothetical protein